jgi:hypothetical protein
MDPTIPALSLRQPWLWAILHAGKRIENRTWATKYRGRIRLHAAKTWDAEGEEFLLKTLGFCGCPSESVLQDRGEIGAYLGEVTVVNCGTLLLAYAEPEQGRWAFGPWCWVLKDPIAYPEPIPGRGYPGLYRPERFEQR